MTGFEVRTSGIGSARSTNGTTTTTAHCDHFLPLVVSGRKRIFQLRGISNHDRCHNVHEVIVGVGVGVGVDIDIDTTTLNGTSSNLY